MGRNKLRHYKGMERSGRVRRKRHCGVGIRGNSGGEISCGFHEGGGEKIVCRFGSFGGGGRREAIDLMGKLGVGGNCHEPRSTPAHSQILWSTLGVAIPARKADSPGWRSAICAT